MFNKSFKFLFSFFQLFALALTLLPFGIGGQISPIFQPIEANAQGTGPIGLKPGQSYTFTVEYKNDGDTPELKSALLEILVGSELEVVNTSFTDKFETQPQYAVTPTARLVVPLGNWGATLNYRPRSATNPSAPSGAITPGDVQIAQSTEKGQFKFEARLKADVLSRYSVGDILDEDILQGVRSDLKFKQVLAGGVIIDGTIIPSRASIRILAADACGNGATNPPTCTCATGQVEVAGQCTDVVDAGNLENCAPAGQNITIGQPANCRFDLRRGSTANRFTLPTGNTTANIATATGNSPACTIINNNTPSVALQCNGIPSTSGTAGPRDVLVSVGGATAVSKGNVELSNIPGCTNGATNPPTCTTCPTGQILTNNRCESPCSNGAINPPTCTTCPTGQTLTNNRCESPCTNGATNPPTCTTCPTGQSLVNNRCESPCTNGATNPPTCTTCPTGQTLTNNRCESPCSNGAINPPACNVCIAGSTLVNNRCESGCSTATATRTECRVAKPDTDTTDNDTVGGDNEPAFTDIIFNPEPGIIGEKLNVKTTGLINNFNDLPLDGAPCTTILTGPRSFSVSATGTVTGGVCDVDISSTQTPKIADTFNASTQVAGPNGTTLTTPSERIRFINPAQPDDNTSDDDGNGGDNEPTFTDITFNPNPGRTKKEIEITTTGLINDVTKQPLSDAKCKTTLFGTGGYNRTEDGTVDNGKCVVVFDDNITPANAGTYTAYTEVDGRNGNLRTPSKTVQFVNPARPDTDTTDNDGVGGDNEPTYTDIIFNPDPAIVGQQLTATTTGLINDNTGQPLDGAPCTTYLTGKDGNSFNLKKSGDVVGGQCAITFNSNETPTTAGTYCAYTEVFGPTTTLRTKCEDILFTITIITPRTGGGFLVALSAVLLIGGASGAGFYYYTRIRRMKID